MSKKNTTKKRTKRNWSPYILILPALVYLALFFAWPMTSAMTLAVWDEEALLAVRANPDSAAAEVGQIHQAAAIEIQGQQGNTISAEALEQDNITTETWFKIQAETPEGQAIEGWTIENRIRVREEAEDGTPTGGTVRTKLGSGADPLTSVYSEANPNSSVLGKIEARAKVTIVDQTVLEVWYQIAGEENGQTITGWVPSRYIQVFDDGINGRVDRGNSGELTTKFIDKMLNDHFFMSSLKTTLLLMVLIIPVQFVLAVIMALVVQAQLKGNSIFLYFFTIPLGVSDLAVGILWFSIFTQFGLLNTILQSMGFISEPITYLSAETRYWIIIAVWLAEVWRATSIVMIIVVSGLQAIPAEVLEAAEIFGAGLWQRVRYVILPMLKPSLQVALILRTILALQVFAVVIALSGGDVVTVLANETYRQYVDLRNSNVAAAYAGLILLLSMVSAVFYLRAMRTQEEMA